MPLTVASSPSRQNSSSSLLVPNVPLADKNWFKTGGCALFFAEPTTPQEFQEVLTQAQELDLPLCLIGEGANMLVSDEGFNGLVIRPSLRQISSEESDGEFVLVHAQAGVSLGELIAWCLRNNIIGLEEFSGIPGTVGGAVFINVHYFEFLISQFLVQALVIEKKTGKLSIVDNTWFSFGYNTSRLHQGEHFLVSATFKLKKVAESKALHAQGRRDEMIRHRAKRYPTAGTCGSFFRNFSPQEVLHTKKQLIFVAYYLDKLGVKGELSVGDACVSHQHANMIINKGNATTQDIVTLARTMQMMVHTEFGILPQPECRFIGFTSYPLYTHL